MDSLQTTYHQHAFAFWVVLLLAVIVVGIWVLVVQLQTRRLHTRLESVFAGVSNENTARMLAEYMNMVRASAGTVEQIKSEHTQLAAIMPTVIRHVGLVRFSPFHDTGGDQSFALALLDGKGDGVVLTALHSRSDSRAYAKPIEAGASPYALTPEEIEAIDRAFKRATVSAR
jgi:hypothetical protein